jgi:hypothetical protein
MERHVYGTGGVTVSASVVFILGSQDALVGMDVKPRLTGVEVERIHP